MGKAALSTTSLRTVEDMISLGPDFHGELVRGKLIEMAPAGGLHGIVAMNIAILVGGFVKREKLGATFAAETGFTIERAPDTVRAPDFAFVRNNRLANGTVGDGFFNGAPDLAVEVLSPGNTVKEIAGKVRDYLDNGCGLVWVVNTIRKTVTVHAPDQSDIEVLTVNETLTGGDVLPGFSCSIAEIFG